MEDILRKMNDTITKYANVLSQVLKVDIEILDNKLNRIAGTGRYDGEVNINISDEAFVNKKVIATGEKKIIENPGDHELCMECPKRDECKEIFEMSTPIKIENEVIGVIGFVCFTEKQKKHILDNFSIFDEFLDQISDLISSKVLETIENERNLVIIELFNSIIDKVEEGVMVFDKNQYISKFNSKAQEILKIDLDDYKIDHIQLTETGSPILNYMEYHLKLNDKTYNLAGNYHNVNIGDYYKIFIFRDAKQIKESVLALTAVKENTGLDKILGISAEIQKVKNKVRLVASASSTVLINGESGTGKELFARALHEESERKNEPFVVINCGAIPDNLLESELFGYVKGAFTGADPKGKIGKFELANRGTLFLDEIGDMPLNTQVKFLRALEQKEIIPLGSNETIKVEVRVVAATNKNLEEMIKDNAFREDLYYRLNVIPLQIPPLRDRKKDIRLLSIYFMKKYSEELNKTIISVEDEVWTHIENYYWRGNVRELQNTIEYIINIMGGKGEINTELLPSKLKNISLNYEFEDLNIDKMEERLIKKAIKIYGDDREAKIFIAQKLGIGIATLYRKLKKYDL